MINTAQLVRGDWRWRPLSRRGKGSALTARGRRTSWRGLEGGVSWRREQRHIQQEEKHPSRIETSEIDNLC